MAFRDLKITVARVEGPCSRMKQGAEFHIRNAKLEMAQGHGLCIFALGSLLPVLSAAIIKSQEGEGILNVLQEWRCPDPLAKVIFRIEEE
ncbi:TIGR04076 family protein [candidate division WOR-3 bacterium]|nr:TIGR04076 family protein [candidate division WOR-3 bacterium]